MWLDADDVITEENKRKIFKLIEGLSHMIALPVAFL